MRLSASKQQTSHDSSSAHGSSLRWRPPAPMAAPLSPHWAGVGAGGGGGRQILMGRKSSASLHTGEEEEELVVVGEEEEELVDAGEEEQPIIAGEEEEHVPHAVAISDGLLESIVNAFAEDIVPSH